MFRRRILELFSCDLSKSEAQTYVEEFQCLQGTLDNMQSQTSRHFGKKKAHLDVIEQEQKSLTMKMKGFGAKKKARLDDLEQHQTSMVTDFLDKLEETEGHILHVMQGRFTGIEEKTTDKLKKSEEHILNKMQARMDGFEQQQTSMATDIIARLEDQQTTMAIYVTDGLSKLEKRLEDGLSKLEKRLEDKFSVLIEHKKDTKSRSFPLVLRSTIEVPGMYSIYHISVVTPDKLWLSTQPKLQQVDGTGHVIRTLDDEYEYWNDGGGHTVSEEGDLVFIARVRNSEQSTASLGLRSQYIYNIHKMTSDGGITTLLTPDLPDLSPTCIHSSHINGDLLIGLSSKSYPRTGRVMRCDGTGRKIADIEVDEKGQRLYKGPHYITENKVNGDIVVSDDGKNALVVVDKSGRHRFDYKGQPIDKSFYPRGVCTDVLGRILVSHVELKRSTVYIISLLDQDGRFLTRLLRERQEILCCLCVDEKNNIYVGFEEKIKVFS
uniref:Uncharacterized protein LOC111114969 n=1 Tax=Crassostrea virginica TaxID=6565 RepID=A0A8B8C0P2_CRAVI|nr:uncharacterized protein LOC111114969 [Crassostrea virginica]